MARRQNQKVVQFYNIPTINIGIVIFGLIFIFLGVQIVRSLKQPHYTVYEVQKSYMDTNITGTALALRQETLVATEQSGYINYYIRDGQKVGKNATVYTLDTTGTLSDLIASVSSEGVTLNYSGYSEIRDSITAFQNYYSDAEFSDVYDFKNDLEIQILDIANSQVLDELTASNAASTSFSQIPSTQSGVVTFYQDGYESKQPADINLTDFNMDAYARTPLKTGEIVQSGSPVYKLITSDYWNLILPLSAEDAERLMEDTRVTLLLPNISHEVYGDLTVIQNGDAYFANITLDKLMVNYCNERFLPIEIVMTKTEGLHLPNSAIVDRTVLKVPISYFTAGSQSAQSIYLNVRTFDEDGNPTVTQIAPDIYYQDESYCYVEPNDFEEQAVLVKNDSDETLSVQQLLSSGNTATLTGVYNVNRGIATFQRIEVLASDDEFSIVEEDLPDSLSMYDRIILNPSDIEAGQVIY